MKNFTLLAAILHLFINTVTANGNRKQTMEAEVEVGREEFEVPLIAKFVPNVVNPPETLKPPEFSVAIYNENELLGAGAALDKHYVITLCTLLKKSSALKIAYPVFNALEMETLVQNISVSNVVLHPDCGDNVIDPAKNLGIVRTKEPMDRIKYPKLPSIHIPEEKSKFIISNFRVHNHAATTIETTFWYIVTRKVDSTLCSILFEADNTKFSMEGNLCMAYYHLGGAKSCQGDIGMPLSIRYKDEDTLVGLNLHKHECGHPREAASFVCIKTNKEWIEKVIKG